MGDPSVNTSLDFLNQLRASNAPNDKMSMLLMHILEVQINISQKLDSTIQQAEVTADESGAGQVRVGHMVACGKILQIVALKNKI
jgi:hypothetical protein